MLKKRKSLFDEALDQEKLKVWHFCFYTQKEPVVGKKFRCLLWPIGYPYAINITLKKVVSVETIEPGLKIVTVENKDGTHSIYLSLGSKWYYGKHTYVSFLEKAPTYENTSYLHVLKSGTEFKEETIFIDKITSIKKLDNLLYYVTTLAGKAYYVFIRRNKNERY